MHIKKKACVVIALFLLVLDLGGCTVEQTERDSITINIWSYYRGGQKEVFDSEIERYNQTVGKAKMIVVKHKSFGSVDDINDHLISSAEGEAGALPLPDIFVTYKGIGKKVNDCCQLINFEDYFSEREIDAYVDGFIDIGYIEREDSKKLIMFPIAKSSDILLINDTEFKMFMAETGVEYKDLEEYESLVKVAEKYYKYTDALTPQEGDGKALFGIDSVANFVFVALKQMGVDMLTSQDGETVLNLNREYARKLWDNYYIPVIKGYAGKQGKFVSEDIKVGKLILGLSYTTSASYFPRKTYIDDKAKNISLKVMHSPYIRGGSGFFINQGGGLFVVDGKQSKNEACIDFVKWITRKDNNLDFTIKSSYFPVTKVALKKDVIAQFESENNIDENIVQTLTVGINQFQALQPYTPEAVDGYEEVRAIIEKDFAQFAKDDAKDIRNRLSRGETYNQVYAKYLSDDYFDKWYHSFSKKINITLQNYTR